MARRPLKKVEKIIIIGFMMLAAMMTGLWLLDKQPNRAYYLPANYEGWVSIRYNVKVADPLPVKDGVLQFHIPENGQLETSDALVVGWRRDDFFYQAEDGSTSQIPASVKQGDDYYLHIHKHSYYAKDWTSLLLDLPFGSDTVLPDETRLTKMQDEEITYVTGKKTLEYFYVSHTPRPIMFNPPPNPDMKGLESTEDRRISSP